MRRETLSAIFVLGIFSFVVVLAYRGDVILPAFWAEFAAGLAMTGIAVLYWGFKPEIDRTLKDRSSFDPKFDHIEAWLFYGPKVHLSENNIGPEKNSPRHKLVCNTVTKKAYYIDSVVWRMICDGKIRWHSDIDQDLDKWCAKMGYELVRKDARESHLLDLGC
jgi:hypothetical protein